MDRRSFLKAAALMGVTAAAGLPLVRAAEPKKKLKALFLGGRDFLGPMIIEELIAAGVEVTIFNRGTTNPHLFPALKWIQGDRDMPEGAGLGALRQDLASNQYDFVIDTWQQSPQAIWDMLHVLRGKVGSYHYTSSIAVYSAWDTVGRHEGSPLKDLRRYALGDPDMTYGYRKLMSEQIIRMLMGGNSTVYRAHGIRGWRIPDPTDEGYWPIRLSRGGDTLLPRADNHMLQMTDAVSLARYILHCAQNDIYGDFNVAYEPMSFDAYLGHCEPIMHPSFNPVWMDAAWLKANDLHPYRDVPFWRPDPVGFYSFDVSRAHSSGLVNRSVTAMVQDQLKGYRERHPDDGFPLTRHGMIHPDIEAALLQKWRAEKGAG